jgi:hypothetical protein
MQMRHLNSAAKENVSIIRISNFDNLIVVIHASRSISCIILYRNRNLWCIRFSFFIIPSYFIDFSHSLTLSLSRPCVWGVRHVQEIRLLIICRKFRLSLPIYRRHQHQQLNCNDQKRSNQEEKNAQMFSQSTLFAAAAAASEGLLLISPLLLSRIHLCVLAK